jgi:uncharacterized protein YehS (DUF1456 family)
MSQMLQSNVILRRIRYIFELDDSKMIQIFAHGGQVVTRAQVSDWLKKEEDPAYQACGRTEYTAFLNGLIVEKRGAKEGGQPPVQEDLNNNIIFRKLKIALNLQADEVLAILKRSGFGLSKHELSAFFRKPGHKHYRECKDQALRSFLKGLQSKPDTPAATKE